MNYKRKIIPRYILLSSLFLVTGILFFSFYNNWILFRFPSYHKEVEEFLNKTEIPKKKIELIFWHNDQWGSEKTTLIWHPNKTKSLHYLINSWLTFLDDEQIMKKKVTLQSVLLAGSDQEALLSFDRTPFDQESSTFAKWMWIEGILKTIRASGLQLQRVKFLVHHQPLQDEHLDFSNPWPLFGFIG